MSVRGVGRPGQHIGYDVGLGPRQDAVQGRRVAQKNHVSAAKAA